VVIKHPSTPSSLEAWTDAAVTATAVPDGAVPDELSGIALSPWTDHPRTAEGWDYVDGLNEEIDEPPMEIGGKKLAAGAVILEPDGRVWLVHPTNQDRKSTTSELQSRENLVCRLLLEKKK